MNNITINHAVVNNKFTTYRNIIDFLDFINHDNEFLNHVLKFIKKKIPNA